MVTSVSSEIKYREQLFKWFLFWVTANREKLAFLIRLFGLWIQVRDEKTHVSVFFLDHSSLWSLRWKPRFHLPRAYFPQLQALVRREAGNPQHFKHCCSQASPGKAEALRKHRSLGDVSALGLPLLLPEARLNEEEQHCKSWWRNLCEDIHKSKSTGTRLIWDTSETLIPSLPPILLLTWHSSPYMPEV